MKIRSKSPNLLRFRMGYIGPGPGSWTRVLIKIGPKDPGPLGPGVFGITNQDQFQAQIREQIQKQNDISNILHLTYMGS